MNKEKPFVNKNKKTFYKKSKPNFQKKRKKVVPREVRELATKHGLLIYTALAIHKGKITLEEALKQLEEKKIRKEKAMKICAEYPEIKLALACSIVKENIPVPEFMRQKEEREKKQLEKEMEKKAKMELDSSQQFAFSTLTQYVTKKTKLVLEKYKYKQNSILLEEFTPYEFHVAHEEKNKKEKIHRLEVKYMYEKSMEKIVKKFIMTDKSLQKKRLRPSHKRDGRFKFPEGLLDKGNEVMLALHEGEMLRGTVIWETPFDLMLNLANNKIWVFKHAVTDCMLIKKA